MPAGSRRMLIIKRYDSEIMMFRSDLPIGINLSILKEMSNMVNN
jgi:hypothetical protein